MLNADSLMNGTDGWMNRSSMAKSFVGRERVKWISGVLSSHLIVENDDLDTRMAAIHDKGERAPPKCWSISPAKGEEL